MKISFPQLADYHIPIQRLIKKALPMATILDLPITKKTLEIGAMHSPDLVCSPFKYNLGNFIEALEKGADVLLQAGGGCRFGYYAELQQEILVSLGYEFEFVNLFEADHISPILILKKFRSLGSKISLASLIHQLLFTIKMIKVMDELDFFMRENACFEVEKDSFIKLKAQFLAELKVVPSIRALKKLAKTYLKKYKSVPLDIPQNPIRVGIVGELYNLMEPNANHFIERELQKNRISVSRYTNVSYLLFGKKREEKALLKAAKGYLKYEIGADGTLSVSKSRTLAERGFDGIIHVKPFGCTPEVNAMPMLMNINRDYQIPILYFSFDCETIDTGIQTRLEAFSDMLIRKKQNAALNSGKEHSNQVS